MELDKLRINQLTDEGWAWYQEYLTVLDAYDVDGYADLLRLIHGPCVVSGMR